MSRCPNPLVIEYRPLCLKYRDFVRCNDSCFVDEPISEDEFERYRSQDFWAVYSGVSLVGYGILVGSGKRQRIKRIAIAPEHRNQAYGQQLLSAMMEHATDSGCEQLFLSVQQDNPAAIHIYEKHGFRIVGCSYQYLVDVEALAACAQATNTSPYRMAPIVEFAPKSLPARVERWCESYSYPDNQVFMFTQPEVGYVGFCRLNPHLPGCAPFEVWQPDVSINALLVLFDEHLLPGKKTMRLTFADPRLAETLEVAGYALNYQLFEMSCDQGRA